MSDISAGYSDVAVRPQIIRDAPLLTFFLTGDAAKLGRRVPSPLTLHTGGRLVLNMWFQPDPAGTTGFGAPGPMGITYLAAEVAGDQGATSNRSQFFPGRVWLEHWGSSPAARAYAHDASGLRIRAGETTAHFDNDVLMTTLRLDGQTVVTARARVGRDRLGTSSGHSIYYAERSAPDGACEVARFEVPWISEAYVADDASVDFSFPAGEPALDFVGQGRQTVEALAFRRITLVPYLANSVVQQDRVLPVNR